MTPQYRCVRIDRCFDCPRCKENPHGYSILKIWMCQQGYEPGRPLPAPGGDNGIPDWCPLPVHSDFQSEREKGITELINFDRWFSSQHVCGKYALVGETRQWVHARIAELREGKDGEQE